ncbi:MAG: hypothetical protein DRN71_02670 [Candidatus Nanohalarchaeota archaeon]|nr:MAG: hypothetical protein DRN71_02670 [Candidatus Nanohaloarchaeota archaeon]
MTEDTSDLNMRIIGFGGPRNVDGTTMHSGRWARVIANVTKTGYDSGEIPLNELHLDGRNIDGEFEEWKDIRGVGAPSIKDTIRELTEKGVKVKVNDYNINDHITLFDPNTLTHEFDEELFKILDPTDLCYISTGTVDTSIGRDGHYPFIDAFLQYVETYRDSDKNPVLLVETPMTLAYETTKRAFDRAEELGVGLHENLIEILDPVKGKTVEYMDLYGIKPEMIYVVRSDTQVNLENSGGINKAIIKARANPLWEKGIHEPVPIIRMAESIYGKKAILENINVTHAEPSRTKDGEYMTYTDGTGAINYCATDVVVTLDAVVGDKSIPVQIIESFNRPANRFIEIMVDHPVIRKIFQSSLPIEQYPALMERFGDQQGTVPGYFSQAQDGSFDDCIASPLDADVKGANPLFDFIKAGVYEVYGFGPGLITKEDSLTTAKYVSKMNDELQVYIDNLRRGDMLLHDTVYLAVAKQPSYIHPPGLSVLAIS